MLDLAHEGKVACLVLSRPPVNALSSDMLDGLAAVFSRLTVGDPPNVLWIRSDQPHFCAGADLAQVGGYLDREDGASAHGRYTAQFHEVFNRLESLPFVTIAEIGGTALGGGLELALACDMRVAGNDVRLGLPETGIGLIPAAGGTQRLTRLCGPGVAARLILGGEVVDGAEAERLGLVNWVFPTKDLERETQAIVDRIAGLSGPALAAAKACLKACDDPDRDGFSLEIAKSEKLMKTNEAQRRIKGFLAR